MIRPCSRASSRIFSRVRLGIDRAGGIIGRDQQNPAGASVDLARDVFHVRLPPVVLVQFVRVDRTIQLAHDGAVQRILGTRGQHVVAGVEQRGQATVDDLAAAVADEDALNIAKAVALGLMADGLDRRGQAQRVPVTVVAVDHGLQHRLDHVRRGVKVVFTGIADVEVENLMALARHFFGDDGQITDGIPHVDHAAGGHHFRYGFGDHMGAL